MVQWSPTAKQELEAIISRYPDGWEKAALLPALWLAEREFGTIDMEIMKMVARELRVSPAHVWGVYTFYTQYRRPGDGEIVIHMCSTLPCALRGSERVTDALCEKLGVKLGETTEDGRVTLKKSECLAACDRGPMAMINEKYYYDLTPESACELVDRLVSGEEDPHCYWAGRTPMGKYFETMPSGGDS